MKFIFVIHIKWWLFKIFTFEKLICIGKLEFEIRYLIKIEVGLTYEKCEITWIICKNWFKRMTQMWNVC